MAASDGFTNDDLVALVMAGNEAALQWYAITNNKPLPVRQPASLFGQVFGGDLGAGPGAPGLIAAAPAGSTVLIVGLVIVGAILIFKS